MHNPICPIGVMDSGIGGLTVVRGLRALLPGEDIIYFGDNANCPYGGRTGDDIFALSRQILSFLEDRQVKCTAVACYTISNIIERLRPLLNHPVIGIIESVAGHIAKEELNNVGLLGTEFTVASGTLARLITMLAPNCHVTAKGSARLAALVDRGDFDDPEIEREIRSQVEAILSQAEIDALILGCTHYPIVQDHFQRCYPALPLIDSGIEQAYALKRFLTENDLLNPQKKGSFQIYTSGDPDVYRRVCRHLSLPEPDLIESLTLS